MYGVLGLVLFTMFIAELGTFLLSGCLNVFLTHLFYFPVTFVAFRFPKRGILLATACALVYLALTYLLTFPDAGELIPATMQFYFLVSLGVATSVVSGNIKINEMMYRNVFDHAGSGICLIDAETGDILDSNPQCAWTTGRGTRPWNVTNLATLLPDPEEKKAFLHRLHESGTIVNHEMRLTVPGEPERNLLVSASMLPNDIIIMTMSDITDRKRTEEVLKESERRFRQLADLLPQPVFEFDRHGIFTFVNRSAFDAYGYLPEDMRSGVHFLQTVVPEERERARQSIARILQGRESIPNEYTALRKDGSTFPVLIYSAPILQNGEPVGVRGVIIDITEQKRAEEHDRVYMQQLEFLSGTAMDFVKMPFETDIYAYISDRLLELFPGFMNVVSSIEDEHRVLTVRAAGGSERFRTMIEDLGRLRPGGLCFPIPPDMVRVMLTGEVVELRGGIEEVTFGQLPSEVCRKIEDLVGEGLMYGIGFTRNGKLSGSALIKMPQGRILENPNVLTAFIHQASIALQRKKAEEELRESELKYRILFESSSDGIILITDVIRDCNEQVCEMLGYARDEIIGRTPVDLSPPRQPDGRGSAESAREKIDAVLAGSPQHFFWVHRRRDGTLIDTEVSLKALELGGQIVLFATIRNITERKKAEKAIQQANRKLHLLSSITRHDILNQITGIVGYLELMETMLPPDPEFRDYFRRITEMMQTIQRQVVFTRDYEDMGMHAPRWQRVASTMRAAASSLSLEGISLEIDTGALEVFADPMLERVFFNILENSVRHGGGVTAIRVSFHERDGTGVIVIEDDGIGIPAALKKRIFQREFGKNTGYGLFLVREILSITGMSIRETGEEGSGARFEITVPVGTFRMRGDA